MALGGSGREPWHTPLPSFPHSLARGLSKPQLNFDTCILALVFLAPCHGAVGAGAKKRIVISTIRLSGSAVVSYL